MILPVCARVRRTAQYCPGACVGRSTAKCAAVAIAAMANTAATTTASGGNRQSSSTRMMA
jgi:hypothetical protein